MGFRLMRIKLRIVSIMLLCAVVSVLSRAEAVEVQAENFTDTSGCVIQSIRAGYTGTGYVNMGAEDNWFEWDFIYSDAGGIVTLTFRYASDDTNNRPCDISVNGAPSGTINCVPTGSWGNWFTESIDVTLDPGLNTIRVTVSTSERGPNIDKMDLPVSGLPPLIIYDQADLAGSGGTVDNLYAIYSDSQIPGGLNNQISSFYLLEGHMAIVADLADGTGPGKTYIADDGDMIINTLPAELDNNISFIRVIPWKVALKKGMAGAWDGYPSVGTSWYYIWTYDITRGQDTSPMRGEYVPMSWGKTGTDPEAIDAYLQMDQVTHLLGFNEPDHCDSQSGQWWDLCDVDTAVGYFENLQQVGLRLGSPAPHEEGAGGAADWLTQFVDQAEAADIRIDFIALHWYDWGSNPASNPDDPPEEIFARFKKYLSNAYHQYRRPLWITEWNANIYRNTATQDAFLQMALPYLETLGYVERYSYYQPNSGTGDFFNGDQLTSTGQIYKDHVSTPAYTPKTLPYPWQKQDVGNVAETGDAIYANGTYTVCGTGADIWGTADEFQFVYQPVTGDGEIIARVNSMVQRDVWTKSGVMIRESLDAGSKHVNMLISAENGAAFQYRSATNGTSVGLTQIGIEAPYWVKLVRQGNTLTGYYSQDGLSWTELTSRTISMDATVYVGLVVTSHSDGLFCDTTFTNVSLSWNKSSNMDTSNTFIDLNDFQSLASQWMMPDCKTSLLCLRCDLDYSESVDFEDLIIFISDWLSVSE